MSQLHSENYKALQKNCGFFRLNDSKVPLAGLDCEGNLFFMEDDDHLEPSEALRLAAWIIDMFEERDHDEPNAQPA